MVEIEVLNYIEERPSETVLRNDTSVLFLDALKDFKPPSVRYKDDEFIQEWIDGDEYTTELSLLFDVGKKTETNLSKTIRVKRVAEYATPIIDSDTISNTLKNNTKYTNDKSISIILPFDINVLEKARDRGGRIRLVTKRVPSGYTINVKDIDTSRVFSRDYRSAKKSYINKFILGGPIPLVNTTLTNIADSLEYNFRASRYYSTINTSNIQNVKYSTGQQVKLRDDISMVTDVFSCSPSGNDSINVQSSFYISGLQSLYDIWYLQGLKSQAITNEVEMIKQNKEHSLAYAKSLEIIEQNRLLHSRLLFICRKKYPNLFNQNSKECIFKRLEDFSVDKLPNGVRRNIELSMRSIIEAEKAQALSTCEHVKSLRDFTVAKYDGEKIKRWKMLKGFILEDNSNFSTCKLCGANIVCKHIEDLWDSLSARGVDKGDRAPDSSVVYSRIINKYTFDNITNKKSSKGRYSCKICGEDFGSAYEFGISKADIKYKELEFSDMNKIIYDVVSRRAEIRHDATMNKTAVSQMIEIVIEPHVGNIMQMAVAFANNGDITTIVDMYTILYTYSAIVAIWDIDGSVYFKQTGPSYVVQKENLRSKFINAFSNLIKNYGEKIVMDHEKAKEAMLKGYGLVREEISEWISNKKKTKSTTLFSQTSVAEEYIKNNPTGKQPSTKPALPVLAWAVLNGAYKRGKQGGKARPISSKKHIVPVENNSGVYSISQTDIKNIASLYSNIINTAYSNWLYFIDNKIYDIPVLTKEEQKSDTWKTYVDKMNSFKELERRIIQATTLVNTYAYSQSHKSNARYYYKRQRNLNPYICVKTNSKHSFSIYVFKKKDGTIVEIPKKKISPETISEYEFVDHKCSNCGKTQQELKKEALDEDAINSNWSKQLEADGFYTMFENRCPEGEKRNDSAKKFHAFTKNSKTGEYTCDNCGMTWNIWLKRDKDWYLKYIDVYKSKSLEALKSIQEALRPKKYTQEAKQEYKQYSEEDVRLLVRDFSDTFSVSPHKVYNLGNTETLSEEALTSENNKNITRIRKMKLAEHIRLVNIIVSKARLSNKDDLLESKSKKDNELAKLLDDIDVRKVPKQGIKVPTVEQNENTIFGNLLTYLINLHGEATKLANFIVEQIFDIDILYTDFDYAQLKKTFQSEDVVWDESIDDVDLNGEDDMFQDWNLTANNMDDDIEME